MRTCLRCVVRGRVQGVAFRANAQARARALQVTGWVRNLPDGSVETLACGEAADVTAFRDWLWQGPRHASVQDVQCSEEPPQALREFTVRL